MMLGMSLETFTRFHVILSLIGIVAGYIAIFGWIAGRTMEGWIKLFLLTTIATSVTGYGFPFVQLLPSHIVGAISLVVLAVAVAAKYKFHLAGKWRRIFVISSAMALYLNSFVAVVQAFLKVPDLKAIAPTQSEAPFVAAQVAVLAFVAVLTILVEVKVRQTPVHPARA